ncbi:MAG: SRPBCC family protein [Methanomicrobiales archaeon]|nr:SRPBCC family protein [Methanomicrobiales archaeon]
MARIEESVDIKRPVEQIFTYTTDAKHWPKWNSVIVESEQTSPGPVGVGTTFRGTSRLMGRSMPWTAKVTEFEANRGYGKKIDSGAVIIEQHNTYHPMEGGTRFTILYDMKVGGFLKILTPLMASSMRKELKKSLGNLKGVLEV